MTTFPFSAATPLPFTFQPTLDGNLYSASVTWNIFGQRPYLNILTLGGDLVFSLPLVGSECAINLANLTWSNGLAIATLDQSQAFSQQSYPAGLALDLTIKGAAPDVYNGAVRASVITPTSFSYPLSPDPGPAASFGQVSYDVSLTAGYFDSTLVYREFEKLIEVSP
jgi:hypothetical protein